MKIPDLEEMVAAVEREVGYNTPRIEALEMVKLMVGQYQEQGTLHTTEFERIVGLALNAGDTNEDSSWEDRFARQRSATRTILSHYIVTQEDARLANDRDKANHIRVEGVLAALQADIGSPGDWTDRSE